MFIKYPDHVTNALNLQPTAPLPHIINGFIKKNAMKSRNSIYGKIPKETNKFAVFGVVKGDLCDLSLISAQDFH